jgi:hypothetical protein
MKPITLLFALCFLLATTSCARRVVSGPETVTIVKTAPAAYKIVKIKGKRYYTWNGNHYRKTRRGFILMRL